MRERADLSQKLLEAKAAVESGTVDTASALLHEILAELDEGSAGARVRGETEELLLLLKTERALLYDGWLEAKRKGAQSEATAFAERVGGLENRLREEGPAPSERAETECRAELSELAALLKTTRRRYSMAPEVFAGTLDERLEAARANIERVGSNHRPRHSRFGYVVWVLVAFLAAAVVWKLLGADR